MAPAAATAALTSAANPAAYGTSVDLTATLTGVGPNGGNVDFKEGGAVISGCAARPLTVVNATTATASCVVSSLAAGARSLTAAWNGDAQNLAATSAVLTETITPAASTTVLASSVNPRVYGQPVTLTATVTGVAPAGTVTFRQGGSPISGCSSRPLAAASPTTATATCSAGALAASATPYALVANFTSGDGNQVNSSSNTVNQRVDVAASQVQLASSANPATAERPVTLTATVSPVAPGSGIQSGTVMFKAAGVVIAGCGSVVLSSGRATCTTTFSRPGTLSITADYSGDTNFGPASGAPLSLTLIGIGLPAPTLTPSVSPANPAEGQPVTVSATVVGNGTATPTGS